MNFKIGRVYLFVHLESALRTIKGDINTIKSPKIMCADDKGIFDALHFKHTGEAAYRFITKFILKEMTCNNYIVDGTGNFVYTFKDEEGGEYRSENFYENHAHSPKPEDFGDYVITRTNSNTTLKESFVLMSNLIRNAYVDSVYKFKEKYYRNEHYQCDDKVMFMCNGNEAQVRFLQFLISIIPSDWELIINLHRGSKFDIVKHFEGNSQNGIFHEIKNEKEIPVTA